MSYLVSHVVNRPDKQPGIANQPDPEVGKIAKDATENRDPSSVTKAKLVGLQTLRSV
jgi:hypothetical protein